MLNEENSAEMPSSFNRHMHVNLGDVELGNRQMSSSKIAFMVAFASVTISATTSQSFAQSESITTGAVSELIRDEIPEAPTGFETREQAVAAIAAGKVAPINMLLSFKNVRVRRNVRYSKDAGERGVLDLYQPNGESAPRSGLILIHGGGWRGGSKTDYAYYGQQFAQRGFVAASINYRLAPANKFPDPVHDAKAAVRWMRRNAAELNVDPDRIAVFGGSAGGHLAQMVGYTDGVSKFAEDEKISSAVQAVVSIYGPCHLGQHLDQAERTVDKLIVDFVGGTGAEVEKNVIAASPLTYLTKDDPPTLLIHGTIDRIVPVAQSDDLADKLKELEIPYVYDRLPGWPHAMDIAKPVNDRVIFLTERFLRHALPETTNEEISTKE